MHYCQPQPRFRAAAIAPGAEQPDIESPRWSNCTVPVVFWPYWCAAADFSSPSLRGQARTLLHDRSTDRTSRQA